MCVPPSWEAVALGVVALPLLLRTEEKGAETQREEEGRRQRSSQEGRPLRSKKTQSASAATEIEIRRRLPEFRNNTRNATSSINKGIVR